MQFANFIRHPEQIDADTVKQLRAMVTRYPYFQTARLLYQRGLYQLTDEHFGSELRHTALCVPDRVQLYQLIEGNNLQPATTSRHHRNRNTVAKVAEAGNAGRTISLIDNFLAQQPEPQPQRHTHAVDGSVDYMAYLMQLEDAPADTKSADDSTNDISQTTPSAEPQAQTKDGEEAFLTETLARIYIKQGKYRKAIEIIRRISLRNPKKNRYFADQIRFLEKLIANEEVLNNENNNNK